MSNYELGSIIVKSPKLISVLEEIAQIDAIQNPKVCFAIVGEAGTGKSTMAQYIQQNVFKSHQVQIVKSVQKASDVSSNTKIFTILSERWSQLQNELQNENLRVIVMPSLKDRKQDLAELADFFLKVLSLMNGRPQLKLTEKAVEMIVQYSWPGQFHEFETSLEAASEIALKTSTQLLLEPHHFNLNKMPQTFDVSVGMKLEDIERNFILQTLYFVHQNRTKAAEILGISIRTLRNKINQYRQEGYL